jgi:Outer membrane protein beta-barrel domain
MNNVYATILVALYCLNTEGVFAQNRFKAGVFSGINFSQIHGDNQDGYQKKGLSLGLTGSMVISQEFELCTELLYNEKGASAGSLSPYRRDHFYSDISLKYSEVAFLAHYFFRPKVDENYYKQSLKIGISYGRLLKSQTDVAINRQESQLVEETLTQNYNRDDFSFVAAWSYYLSPRLAFSVRHTNTLSFLFKSNPALGKTFMDMRPYFLGFHLSYDFITSKKNIVVKKRKKARYNPLEEL